MFKSLILIFTLLGLQAHAKTFLESQGDALYIAPQCPTISSDYSQALSNLKKMKAEILTEAGCESLDDATARLKGIVEPGRTKAYDIIRAKRGKMLSSGEAALIESYATEVGQAASEVFSLMGVSDCPISKEKKSLIYKSLMGLSFDAIAGLGGIVGPYGAPLSMGFSALKGVMNGFFKYNKANSGYKFAVSESGRDEAKLYVKSLCTFYEFKVEADKLLNVSDRKNSYLNLKNYLERKVYFLTRNGVCDGCNSLVKKVVSFTETSEEVMALVESINNQSSDNLGDHLLDALQTQLWLQGQIEKLEIDALDYNESIGPAVLGRELEELEDFLVYTETEDFMGWILDETKSSYQDYRDDVMSWTVDTHFALETYELRKNGRMRTEIQFPYTSIKKPRKFISVYDYKEYLVNNQDKLDKSSVYKDDNLLINSKYNKSVKKLKNVNRFISSHNEYCNFFKLAGYYDAVHLDCNSEKMEDLNEAFLRQAMPDPKLAGIVQEEKDKEEEFDNLTNNLEDWSSHLPKLFNKWEKIEEQQINIFLSN